MPCAKLFPDVAAPIRATQRTCVQSSQNSRSYISTIFLLHAISSLPRSRGAPSGGVREAERGAVPAGAFVSAHAGGSELRPGAKRPAGSRLRRNGETAVPEKRGRTEKTPHVERRKAWCPIARTPPRFADAATARCAFRRSAPLIVSGWRNSLPQIGRARAVIKMRADESCLRKKRTWLLCGAPAASFHTTWAGHLAAHRRSTRTPRYGSPAEPRALQRGGSPV